MTLIADLALAWMMRHPRPVRVVAGLARRHRPLMRFGHTVFVTRADDARDVLERAEEFELGPMGRPKMLLGDFLLGMDPGPSYASDKRDLRRVLDAVSPKLADLTTQACDTTIRELHGLEFDALEDYAQPAMIRVAIDTFGVPATPKSDFVSGRRPGEHFGRQLRMAASLISMGSPAPFGLQEVAEGCAAELRDHLDATVRSRWTEISSPPAPGATVLDYLIWAERVRLEGAAPETPGDEVVTRLVRNLGGLMLAATIPIMKSFVHALDELIRWQRLWGSRPKPGPLEAAIAAARANRLEELGHLIREAWRFNPTFPVVVRYCPDGATIAPGTSRQIEVPAGSTVNVVLLSAMFDDSVVDRPEEFGFERSGATWLQFGAGVHACLGESEAMTVLTQLFRRLLLLPEFEHARRVRLVYDGPAVDRYALRIDRP